MLWFVPRPIRGMARRYIEKRGFTLAPPSQAANLNTVMQRRNLPPVATVVDVGASDGRWTRQMMQYYPAAHFLLVEAQEAAHGTALRQFQAEHYKVVCEMCAAGNRKGQIHFDATDPLGGQASSQPYAKNDIIVPMETVDDLISKHNLSGPFLLKLDTHGFEVPIFEGAHNMLASCAMLIVEAYNFTLCSGCLRFHELCSFLEVRGFRCVDIFDLLVRPHDQTFWQMDMVFIPSSDPLFEFSGFR